MSPRGLKLVGALFIALAVFTLMFRVFGGRDFALMPWPVSLIALAIGAFLLRRGGGVEGWNGGARKGQRLS